ncbi:unnamed protein product [Pea early-browning virus]|uniref:(PEBV) genomic RNA1 for 141K, 201K, 30K and 12K proteins n=1 Tax=Pea early browning virus TaxID=12294 RepID=Q84703_PEBV|nr:hypothetical protein Pebvs1gp4 [Pea early-browning virus]CAA32174.1 unnamed protein product [Pea early-browning virus]
MKCAVSTCEVEAQSNKFTCSMKCANKYNRHLAEKYSIKRKCECVNCGWYPAIEVRADFIEVYFCCGMKHLSKVISSNPKRKERLNSPKRLFRDDIDFGLTGLFNESC